MAGFERYYGAERYSPQASKSDDTFDFQRVKPTIKKFKSDSKSYVSADIDFKPPDSRLLLTDVEFAEAIPYVQLSHSLDSVRSYGWEAHFSSDGEGDFIEDDAYPANSFFIRKPLTLAVKSFSGLKFSSDEATPIGVFGLGNTGNFYLKNPKSGSFTLIFDDLLDANISKKLFGMYLGGKGLPFNIDLYKFDGQKTLKTHFFMKDVKITSIKQSDLVYSNSRDFSTYEVECIVAPTNFYVSGNGTVVQQKDTRDNKKSISPTDDQQVDTTGSS